MTVKKETGAGRLEQIVTPLLDWYDSHKRELPWRDGHNAYATWVSEIMLQQTRVEAVKPYFRRFVTELPNPAALAACPEEKLLKLWEGLGYYNRVRNMQKAAIQMVNEYQGQLPPDYDALKGLSGIGSYTAGAIASIACGIPVPAVDGNVLRVISRVLEREEDIMKQSVKNRMEQELLEIIPKDRPGDFNQALMDLGASVCMPKGMAKCEKCPLNSLCLAKEHQRVEDLPVRARKKPRAVEERTVLVIQDGEKVAIRKRPAKGLLAGLYELPNLMGHLTREQVLDTIEDMELTPVRIQPLGEAKHIFSHIEWRMTGYQIRVAALEKSKVNDMIFVDKEQSQKQYAIPSAFAAYARYLKEDIK